MSLYMPLMSLIGEMCEGKKVCEACKAYNAMKNVVKNAHVLSANNTPKLYFLQQAECIIETLFCIAAYLSLSGCHAVTF